MEQPAHIDKVAELLVMTGFEFGYGERNEFLPKYGGVDWNAVFIAKNKGEDQRPIWGECNDENGSYAEQLHQASCAIYINHTDSSLDCIAVADPRDGNYWWFFRNQSDVDFDEIVRRTRSEVMYVETKYPLKEVAKYFIKWTAQDVEIGEIPKDWV